MILLCYGVFAVAVLCIDNLCCVEHFPGNAGRVAVIELWNKKLLKNKQ